MLAGASDADWRGYDRRKVLDYWTRFAEKVEPYTHRRNYLHIEDRPVLQRGWAHNLRFYRQFDVEPREIADVIREVIPSLYLLATATEREVYPLLKSWGFDGLTQYLLHGKGWENTMEVYRWSWAQDLETAKKYNLHYIVPFTSGYDGAAWDTPESRAGFSHVPTPAQFTAHVREAKRVAQENVKYTLGLTLGYSWNERGESRTVIEPSEIDGGAYLDALRAA